MAPPLALQRISARVPLVGNSCLPLAKPMAGPSYRRMHQSLRSAIRSLTANGSVTIFGLQTNGRTESILMSLPPMVRWEYGYTAEAGSRESLLTELFTKPQDWLNDPSLDDRCRPHGAIS